MKPVFTKPDLSGWNLDGLDKMGAKFKTLIEETTGEAIHYAMKESYIMFPAEWGDSDGLSGKAPKNPLTVYLRLGIEDKRDEKPTYSFDLQETLRETIRDCANDGSFSDGLERIASGLRELAGEIDQAIEKSNG